MKAAPTFDASRRGAPRSLIGRLLLMPGIVSELLADGVTPSSPHDPLAAKPRTTSLGFFLVAGWRRRKGGITFGESDEYGMDVAQGPVHVHDFHATILHLMGFNHTRLTYRHTARDYRLTDVHGRVITSILA